MKVASSIVLNIERARETGELDYLVTIKKKKKPHLHGRTFLAQLG